MIGFGTIEPTQDGGRRQLEAIMTLTCGDDES